ncbi:MAG: large subunit ribosomal protein [Desulfovibrionales bacterium]|jgi:large subunit ribosomal protein L25|nr:large subunit ribosomal protein [Desulfovibrionales bacterium]
MAELQSLSVQERIKKGKGGSRELRRQGFVPGVYYDQKSTNIPVRVMSLPLVKLYEKVGSSRVFDLMIEANPDAAGPISSEGKGHVKLPALIWDIQYDPVKGYPVHVDFFGVDLDKPIRVMVPVEVKGRARGQEEGGTLVVFRESLEVHALPLAIPESIALDVSGLAINENIHVEQISLPEGVEFTNADEGLAVVGVVAPAAEEVEEEETEEAVEPAAAED